MLFAGMLLTQSLRHDSKQSVGRMRKQQCCLSHNSVFPSVWVCCVARQLASV